MDPALSALFQSSQVISKSPGRRKSFSEKKSLRHEIDNDFSRSLPIANYQIDGGPNEPEVSKSRPRVSRKRKHETIEDDIEGRYMQRVAREQEREDTGRKSAEIDRAVDVRDDEGVEANGSEERSQDGNLSESEENSDSYEIPVHESLASGVASTEVERASRTVFLANVSTLAIKSKASRRALLEHMASFISELPDHQPPHSIESIRFRSTAFSTASLPKKAAFVKKELMDATTKSTNAYIVYTTSQAAREAVKRLNGTVVLDRHIRVDGVAHPSQVDHRRCVFVGNLGFVDDESMMKAAEEGDGSSKPKKAKPAADVEEGLWREFGKAGAVESVRVVRDKTTRVGKGFAYVQFKDQNAVERALSYHDKRFPPLLPRKLRVTRAKNIAKTSSHTSKDRPAKRRPRNGVYNQKPSSQFQSLAGRAKKLLGHAGAARTGLSSKISMKGPNTRSIGEIEKAPEQFVFEGNRARISQGKGIFKSGTSKKQGKPTTRSSKRGASFKAAGGKKKRA